MTKQIMKKLAFLLSVVMVVSLFANVNWTVRAADTVGEIAVTISGNGTLDYTFYELNGETGQYNQCEAGGAGQIKYNDENKVISIPATAVKMTLKAYPDQNWQSYSASGTKNNDTLSAVDNGIFGEAGITIDGFTNADGFSLDLNFSEQQQQSGLNIPAGSVGFEINNSQNGVVYYSFTGTDGSWVETRNNDILDSDTCSGQQTVYVKAVPNEGQSVDVTDGANYVDIAGDMNKFAASELTGGVASFAYSSDKAHKVHIEFAGSSPSVNAGDIPINIVNAQNGTVNYKVGDSDWQTINGSYFTLRTSDELKDATNGTTITFKVEPNPDQSLDTNQGQNWIQIGDQTQADISTEQLLNGTYSISYNPTSTYSMQIKFNGGNGGDGGNGATSYGKDGILEFNIENPDKGDVFFQIGEGTRYRVGGTEEVSEETIQNALSETTFTESDTIIVWAEERGGKIVGNFDIRIGGTSVFVTDDERTAARTAAESGNGYTFTVPADYNGQDRIEFAIEFRDETSGGGDNDYDEFYPDVDSGLYMVELKNCNASCGSVSFVTAAEASKVNPGDENVSKSRFQGNTVIISFTPVEGEYVDRIRIGQTEYRPGDEDFVPPSNMTNEGEVFTYITQASDFDEYGYLYIEVGFTGGNNGVNCYGKDDKLAFNIANSDKGNVFFKVNSGDKYRVGGDDRFSESDIIDELKYKEFAAAETITIWAENGEGVNVSHFDIRIAENSAFGDDTTRDGAKNAAQGESGYTFTVPDDYTSDKLIEFQIEFSGGGSGDNDVTYTEDATISEDTIKNDITVNAGTLTIDNCSVRVDHRLVVESGATIVGTSASSKLIFASGAFSSGIALYYQDEKISDDNNNDFSNNGDGLVEFIWNTTSSRWVTEQPPAEGGGDAPWYTVSYGSSANLNTKNGKVYAERVHIGDITYSSIASEYNASDTDKIYSMEDTIFRQKTEEEENNPDSGYVDPLMKYGIGGSDGDIMIRPDVSGVSIDFKFIPDFGYQLTNVYTNEEEKDTLLNDFVAAEAVSSFTFDVKQGNNVHFQVKFEEVDNTITGNA